MPAAPILPADFYARPPEIVARDLLGARLVRQLDGERMAGIIVETEAYSGPADKASHARAGRTERTRIMFGPPGRAYVYFTYGVHWMLNIACQPEGEASAVLIRAIHPVEGLDALARQRPRPRPHTLQGWTDGPAKVCQALAITGALNGADIITPAAGLWVEAGPAVADALVITGPRVGIDYAPEPWKSMPWRFRTILPE